MLSVQENDRLTRVGPGTPMGELMRRYWHPIATTGQLMDEPTRAIRILCESLVLYKDRSGTFGLIQESCPHRRVNLLYGIPEQHGLRCPYHGWLFDETGRCLEMPAEAPDSTFKDRVTALTYPVQELGGLIWAYLGPEPVPLLPRWDLFVQDGLYRDAGAVVVPCNWLQLMENSVDPVHLEHLHGNYFPYLAERGVLSQEVADATRALKRHHLKIGFDVFEYGIIKRRMVEGQTEEDQDWRVGHPLVFPYTMRMGGGGRAEFHIRVPMDDTHTWHLWYMCYNPGPGVEVPKQETLPLWEVPLYEADGSFVVDYAEGQDIMTWVTQGDITNRSLEKLAESDKGLILYRRLLQQQLGIVEDGGDPINVFRDPSRNQSITLTHEEDRYNRSRGWNMEMLTFAVSRYSPNLELIKGMFAGAAAAEEAQPLD